MATGINLDTRKIFITRPVAVSKKDYTKIGCQSADTDSCFTHILQN